jgi:hypothetical protein
LIAVGHDAGACEASGHCTNLENTVAVKKTKRKSSAAGKRKSGAGKSGKVSAKKARVTRGGPTRPPQKPR